MRLRGRESHGWELGGGTYGWEFEVGDAQMETLRNLKGEDPQMVIQGRNPVDGM